MVQMQQKKMLKKNTKNVEENTKIVVEDVNKHKKCYEENRSKPTSL